MRNETLVKTFVAEGGVVAHTLVKAGSADGLVAEAAAAGDSVIGVSTILDSSDTERCDVVVAGIAEVIFGGNVAMGDLLTSDSSGQAVVAAPAAGTNNRIIGQAMTSGVSGDIGSVLISTGSIQG